MRQVKVDNTSSELIHGMSHFKVQREIEKCKHNITRCQYFILSLIRQLKVGNGLFVQYLSVSRYHKTSPLDKFTMRSLKTQYQSQENSVELYLFIYFSYRYMIVFEFQPYFYILVRSWKDLITRDERLKISCHMVNSTIIHIYIKNINMWKRRKMKYSISKEEVMFIKRFVVSYNATLQGRMLLKSHCIGQRLVRILPHRNSFIVLSFLFAPPPVRKVPFPRFFFFVNVIFQ